MAHKTLKGPFTPLYEEARLEKDIRRSLNLIFLGNVCGTLFGIICGGSTPAMVGLAGYLGANDLVFGIIAALIQGAALLQIPFSALVNLTHKRKKYLLTYGLISRAMWLIVGLIPFILPMSPQGLRLWSLVFLVGLSSAMGAMINVCWFPWFSDLAPLSIRGRWLSGRDMIMSGASVGMGLLIAWLLDTIPEPTRYMIVFFIGGGIGVLDMLCFGFAKEVYTVPPKKLEFKTVVRDLLHDKPFMRFMIMWTAWCFTAQMSGVYLAPYAMQVMRLSAMQYMIYATIAAAVSTVLFIRYWGIAMDRFGCRSVMFATCIVAALTPAFYLLQTPGSIWPTLLHNFIGAAFWSGSNLASNSMQLSSSPDKYRPTYIAVFSCVTALLGNALGPLFGGAILDTCARHNWFTGSFDRYKFMILLSVILRLLFVLLFVPKLKNDRPVTFRDMLRAMALRHEAEQAQKAAGKE